MDTGGNLDFLKKKEVFVKNYPHPLKPKAIASIRQTFKQMDFIECTRHAAFIKTHIDSVITSVFFKIQAITILAN